MGRLFSLKIAGLILFRLLDLELRRKQNWGNRDDREIKPALNRCDDAMGEEVWDTEQAAHTQKTQSFFAKTHATNEFT